MIRVCSACRAEGLPKEPFDNLEQTHGICPRCLMDRYGMDHKTPWEWPGREVEPGNVRSEAS